MATSSASRRLVTWALLATALVWGFPRLAGAQQPAQSFDQLNTLLKPGDTVWVTDAAGLEVKGKVADLRPSSLTLGKGRTLRQEEVSQVSRQKGNRSRVGALCGAGVGFVLGAMLGHRDYERDVVPYCSGNCSSTGHVFGSGALFAAIGAGAGALVGHQIPAGREVVYRQPGSSGGVSSRLSVAPVITLRTKGVTVAFSF